MNDFRIAIRQLLRHPGFATVALLTLALGIGANTAIFSVINAVLVNPFPYPESERIAFIGQTRENQPDTMPVTYPDYLEWRAQNRSFEELAWVSNRSFALTGIAEAAYLSGATATASVWPLLRVRPALGTTFGERDDKPGADPVCVISHSTWQDRFGGDPRILGRSIALDGRSYVVVGVMPASFKFWAADVWIPAGLDAGNELMQSRVLRMGAWVVGRLKDGVDVAEAERDLDVISTRLAAHYPDSNVGVGAGVILLGEAVTRGIRPALLVLFGAVGCLLLIACLNVANLLLARATAREREFGVRVALGASRRRILRQVLVENLPLSLAGGIAGVLLAQLGLTAILRMLPPGTIPAEAQIELSWPVLGFAVGLSLASTLVFGMIAALSRSTQVSVEALREAGGGTGSRGTRRLRSALVVGEVALALTLLIGAGLLLRNFDRLQRVDPGFDTSNLLLLPLRLPQQQYPSSNQATQFYVELLERLRALPGVRSAGAGINAPMMGGSDLPLLTEGRTYTDLNQLDPAQFNLVMGDYFAAQGLVLKQGRVFSDADGASSAPVVVLNEAAVRKFLPGQEALGKRVMVGMPENLIKPGMLPPGLDEFHWSTVVGVVSDARHFGLQSDPPPTAYLPIEQGWAHVAVRSNMTVLLRTEGDPLALAALARQALRSVDSNLPVQRVASMEQVLRETLSGSRFNAALLGTFAALALALSAIGIYGVVAWNVAQRSREVGIRIALGANRRDVVGQVIGDGMRAVLLGVALGLAGGAAASQLLRSMLNGIGTLDPWVFALVPLLLVGVALVACWVPARRAARVDPMIALRAD